MYIEFVPFRLTCTDCVDSFFIIIRSFVIILFIPPCLFFFIYICIYIFFLQSNKNCRQVNFYGNAFYSLAVRRRRDSTSESNQPNSVIINNIDCLEFAIKIKFVLFCLPPAKTGQKLFKEHNKKVKIMRIDRKWSYQQKSHNLSKDKKKEKILN